MKKMKEFLYTLTHLEELSDIPAAILLVAICLFIGSIFAFQ